MLAPHMAAAWSAAASASIVGGRIGAAFTVSPKAASFVLEHAPGSIVGIAGRFRRSDGLASAWLWSAGALPGYWDEVWRWGRIYAGTTFVDPPLEKRPTPYPELGASTPPSVIDAIVGQASGRRSPDRRRWLVWLLDLSSRSSRRIPLLPPILLPASSCSGSPGISRIRANARPPQIDSPPPADSPGHALPRLIPGGAK